MSEQKEVALLLWMEDEEIKARWRLSKPVISIGRWDDNDIVIDDRWISRYHARIRHEGDEYVLEDLGSKNGTIVNGQRIVEPVTLSDGDVIQLTPLREFTFVDYGATAPLPGETRRPMLELDLAARQVTVQGSLLNPPLSAAQFGLLSLLAQQPGRVYSREEVIEVVWPEDQAEGISDEAIDALVRRIRLRLREVDPDHEYLVTVRGYGFTLEME
jgi:hypothetical protein